MGRAAFALVEGFWGFKVTQRGAVRPGTRWDVERKDGHSTRFYAVRVHRSFPERASDGRRTGRWTHYVSASKTPPGREAR